MHSDGRRKQQKKGLAEDRRAAQKPRRTQPLPSDKDLYSENIKEFIAKERRHDELDRLREVREQKIMWRNTVISCGVLNIIFIFLGVMGYINN